MASIKESRILLGDEGWAKGSPLASSVNPSNFSSSSLISDFGNLDGMSDYVNHSMLTIVLHTPTGFDVLGERGKMIRAGIVNMFENHTVRMDGINRRLDAEFYESAYGGGGEQFETLTNIMRARSTLATVHNDKRNRMIQKIVEFWMLFFAGDEYSKTPYITSYDTSLKYKEILPSQKTAILLNITPNETKTGVDKAALSFNVFPKGTGEDILQKDIGVKGIGGQLNLEWTCTTQHSRGVDYLAANILDRLNKQGMLNTFAAAGISDIAADTKDLVGGILTQLDDRAKEIELP